MKKIFATIVAAIACLAVCFSLAACGSDDSSASPATAETTEAVDTAAPADTAAVDTAAPADTAAVDTAAPADTAAATESAAA